MHGYAYVTSFGYGWDAYVNIHTPMIDPKDPVIGRWNQNIQRFGEWIDEQ